MGAEGEHKAHISKLVELSFSGEFDGVDHTFAGEPQKKGMMQLSNSFSLITKPRLSNPA